MFSANNCGPLRVSTNDLDFGTVSAQNSFQWHLKIENTSSEDVAVQSVETSCGCTKVEPASFVVPATGVRDLHLSMDLSAKTNEGRHLGERHFAVKLLPRLRDVKGEHSSGFWVVAGQVRDEIVLSSADVDFGDRIFPDHVPQPQQVRVSAAVQSRVAVECTSPLIHCDVASAVSGQYLVRLTLVAHEVARNVGPFSVPVTVCVVGSEGAKLATRVVTVRGRVLGPIVLAPDNVYFGSCELSTTIDRTLCVVSRAGERISVDASEVIEGKDEFSCSRLVGFGSDKEVRFAVTAHVDALGTRRGKIRLLTKFLDRNELPVEQIIPVSYFGLTPLTTENERAKTP